MRFVGLILGQPFGLLSIGISSGRLDQMSPSEGEPHIIEKEQGARLQQPNCCDGSRQIYIDRMAAVEIDDIESLPIPGQPDQVEQVCPDVISQKPDVSIRDAGRGQVGSTFGANVFEVQTHIVDAEVVDGPEPLLSEDWSYADLEKAASRILSKDAEQARMNRVPIRTVVARQRMASVKEDVVHHRLPVAQGMYFRRGERIIQRFIFGAAGTSTMVDVTPLSARTAASGPRRSAVDTTRWSPA
ncbi:hypothetical protein [Bradyrhizobium sp. JR3.5]